MLQLNDRLRLRDDLRHRRLRDEGVLVLQKDAEVVVLNDLGYRIVELLSQHDTAAPIIDALGKEYEVEADVLEKDVLCYLEELVRGDILHSPNRVR